MKGQQSFLRTADEAKRLFRAVDDLQSVSVRTVEYKRSAGYKYYGVLFGHTLISERLPKDEAIAIADALKTCMHSLCATIGQRAVEVMQGRVLSIVGSEKKEPVAAEAIPVEDMMGG